MKNLTFSSPFVAQETVNLLNCNAFIIPPGTSTVTFKALESQALSRAYFLRRPFRGPLENSRIFSNISFDYF